MACPKNKSSSSLKSDSYVVDFQSFKSLENKYIVKELAVVAVNSDIVMHCIIKSPTSYNSLPTEMKEKRVDFLPKISTDYTGTMDSLAFGMRLICCAIL